MGLRQDYKQWKMKMALIDFLFNEFGITADDLRYLPKAIKYVKDAEAYKDMSAHKEENKPVESKQSDMEKKYQTLTPEQFVAQFAGEVEEFYEDGRSGKNRDH